MLSISLHQGKVHNTDHTACVPCPAGEIRTDNDVCQACDDWKYSSADRTQCLTCPDVSNQYLTCPDVSNQYLTCSDVSNQY